MSAGDISRSCTPLHSIFYRSYPASNDAELFMPFFKQDQGARVYTIAGPIILRASVLAHPKVLSTRRMIDPLQNTVLDGQLGSPERDGHLLNSGDAQVAIA